MRMRWNREVDRAIVSGVPETEIRQIKKKYITDRIRESVDIFGSQPERLGSIIMTAVTALALLISKVLDKARELSAKLFEKETIQLVAEPSEGRMVQIIPQTDKVQTQEKSLIKNRLLIHHHRNRSCRQKHRQQNRKNLKFHQSLLCPLKPPHIQSC